MIIQAPQEEKAPFGLLERVGRGRLNLLTYFLMSATCRQHVGDMSATCRRHVEMSPIWPQHVCRGRHILTPTQDFCVGNCRHSHLPHYLLSVVCTQSSTTSMCKGRRLRSMWLDATSLRNARGQTEGTVRCLGGGGGSRGCAWTTIETIGSRN